MSNGISSSDVDLEREIVKCAKYCKRALLNSRIRSLKDANDFNFKNVIISSKPWNYEKFGGKPSNSFLQRFPNDYDLSYDAAGCDALSSFCHKNILSYSNCWPDSDLNLLCTAIEDSSIRVNACQGGCFVRNSVPIDVYWNKQMNACHLTNIAKKIFCLNPFRDNSIPPLSWNQAENSCSLNQKYCEFYGLTFKEFGCFEPGVASFLEKYVIGKTLTRSILHPSLIFSNVRDKKKKQFSCEREDKMLQSQQLDTKSTNSLFTDITSQVGVASTPALATHLANKSLQYLRHVTKDLPPVLAKSVLYTATENIVLETLYAGTVRYLSMFSRLMTGPEFLFATLFSTIIDAKDTFNLASELSTVEFETLMQKFDRSFEASVKERGEGSNSAATAVTPESVMLLNYANMATRGHTDVALNHLYGSVDALVEAAKTYFGSSGFDGKTEEEHFVGPPPTHPVLDHLVSENVKLYESWPVRGIAMFSVFCGLFGLAIYCLAFSAGELLFAILIICAILLLFYIRRVADWE